MNKNTAYQNGITDENIIINKLLTRFPNKVFTSSQQDNILNDIDMWINNKPVSIKCYAPNTPANFAFELQNLHRDTNKWNDSWYYTGKASAYLIWHQKFDDVYFINKQKLIEYVKENDFDRTTELKGSTIESQKNIGHIHINCKLGLLKIAKMLELGIATVLLKTDDYNIELAKYKASNYSKPPLYIPKS